MSMVKFEWVLRTFQMMEYVVYPTFYIWLSNLNYDLVPVPKHIHCLMICRDIVLCVCVCVSIEWWLNGLNIYCWIRRMSNDGPTGHGKSGKGKNNNNIVNEPRIVNINIMWIKLKLWKKKKKREEIEQDMHICICRDSWLMNNEIHFGAKCVLFKMYACKKEKGSEMKMVRRTNMVNWVGTVGTRHEKNIVFSIRMWILFVIWICNNDNKNQNGHPKQQRQQLQQIYRDLNKVNEKALKW